MRTSQPGRWLAQTTEARPAPIVIFDTGTRLLLFLTSRCRNSSHCWGFNKLGI